MNYLLDTHVLLWALSAPEKLTEEMRDILEDPNASIWFSVASRWEVALKAVWIARISLSTCVRFGLPREPRRLGIGYTGLPRVEAEGITRLASGPFDRLLLAQAKAMNLHLLTIDARVLQNFDEPAIGDSPPNE